jgi:dolichol-phosphate mannosyltransferase
MQLADAASGGDAPVPSATVVLPTYNEADNIRAMVGELLVLPVDGLRILVVDDMSPDGTGDIADDLCATYPDRVSVLHREGERGLGRAYVAGFREALERGAQAIIQMDADFSHPPSVIPVLLSHLDQFDVVVGSRYVDGGVLDPQWGWGRRFLSWWANAAYSRAILGLQVKDSTAGFKCWKAEVLQSIDLDSIHSGGYIFQVEMAYICERMRYRVLEVPIAFEDRRIGQSKMSMGVKLEAAWRVFEIKSRYGHLDASSEAKVGRPSADATPGAPR